MRLLAPLVLACVLAGCGSSRPYPRLVETRPAAGFSSVIVRGSVDVNVSIEATPSVQVRCDEKRTPNIVTRVEGTTLVIESRDAEWHFNVFSVADPDGPCAVNVSLPELAELTTTGSGDVHVRGEAADLKRVTASASGDITLDHVRSGRLEINVSGSGDVDLGEISAKEVVADVSGSGGVRASGSAGAVTVRTSGSGDFGAARLRAEICHVHSSGSADVRVFASRRVEAEVSGSGDVHVHGRPPEQQVDVHGSGQLRWD